MGWREITFPQEGPRVPEGTHPEEETSSTNMETDSAPVQGVETRTLSGEQNAINVKALKPEDFLPPPFPPLGS